jgi:tetratricopeptide (TPR) repeat protein
VIRRGTGALLLALALAGCGGEYAGEKLLWKSERLLSEIQKNPSGTPVGLYARTRSMLEEVTRRYPGTGLSSQALLDLGALAALQKDDAKAEAFFERVEKESSKDEARVQQAIAARAGLREERGRWDEALALYQELIHKHAPSPVVLSAPLHIARHYVREKDLEKARAAYGEALGYYQAIVSKYPKSRVALDALNHAFLCFSDGNQRAQALEVLQLIRQEYPGTPEAAQAVRVRLQILKEMKGEGAKAASAKPPETPSPASSGQSSTGQ